MFKMLHLDCIFIFILDGNYLPVFKLKIQLLIILGFYVILFVYFINAFTIIY